MGGSGGGSTTIRTEAQPAAANTILPEGREGYDRAQSFYKSFFDNPPIYGGPRVAPVSPLQTAAIDQAGTSFGAPSGHQTAAENQATRTLEGGYLNGPEQQAAIQSAADPIFARFNEEIMPGIRDRSQFAGQGISSTRRGVATENAIDALGRSIGTSVIAPIYNAERTNQVNTINTIPNLIGAEAARLLGLTTAGQQERAFGQEEIAADQAAFEEPIFRQSGAADALAGLAGTGSGGSKVTQTEEGGAQGWITTLATLGALSAVAKK